MNLHNDTIYSHFSIKLISSPQPVLAVPEERNEDGMRDMRSVKTDTKWNQRKQYVCSHK